MGTTTLMEDFRRLGLSEAEANPLAQSMGVQDADEDSDAMDIIDHYKTEGIKIVKKKRLRGLKKSKARVRRKKAGAKRSRIKSKKKMRIKGAKASWQAGTAKLAKAPKRKSTGSTIITRQITGFGRKGPKKGKKGLRSWREYDAPTLSEELIQNLGILAESLETDPSDRFEKFVEAFNHIADLGELLTLKYHEMEEPEMAAESAMLASAAESVLESMEDLNGALDSEADDQLEEILADAMEDVSEALEVYGEALTEQDEEDDEEEDDEECDPEEEECDEEVEEDVDDDDDDDAVEEEDESDDRLSVMIEAAKKAAKKVAKAKGKVSAWEKSLAKGRKDIKDPDALGGWIQHYGSFNKKTGKGARQGKKKGKR